MFGMQGWQIVIVAAVILLLFGAKRLPEMARGVGRSLKIFKAETKGLVDDDSKRDDSVVADTDEQSSGSSSDDDARAVEPTKVETSTERTAESSGSSSRDA
ncbi:Sec-independent protein translocase subunit TatA [Actinobacteria bacterium YIM 96077]|uniref:Sec-independent protein translocase protein TatA n=1 Tax=Phytoactinopolyspora halophila TaxID=1981511 RepID=A0A329QYX2_9ACTN|nr:Sec-independent protein translocase subunit TatA [Phytoactinopolyspora halophila]AYY13304.1 Sec-independent protein translocase subunit TatA [Actinobacteria bacterium YIM 96077]RAW17461.1 twin-arginine translocase TatA/TatE family subunit [Phytoactinopolyspora halophila]